MTVVKELLEHHMQEEEEDMFKKMRAAFNSVELDQMAINMSQAKKGKHLVPPSHRAPQRQIEHRVH